MSFSLKPAILEKATNAAEIQKLIKADLKSNAGKKGVKFIAAKNCVIGSKLVHLFIVTDNPGAFETVLKAKQPHAYRAKGTCDLAKDKKSGKTTVTLKTSSGQMPADSIAKMLPQVVGHDTSFVAVYTKPTEILLPRKAVLNPTPKVEERGVPEWAKESYVKGAKKTLIASKTPEGEIGSIYFGGKEGRIRTTHAKGPEKKQYKKLTTVQFNVNGKLARAEYEKAKQAKTVDDSVSYRKWLANRLKDVTRDTAPTWAKLVDSPETAHDLSTGKPSKNVKLFEIFKKINGKVENWHPSRGTAVKFETDKQTVSVLQAAIALIDKECPLPKPLPKDEDEVKRIYSERNVKFYEFVESRLPESEIVKAMRRPEEFN